VEGIIVNQFQPQAKLPLQLIDELLEEDYPVLPTYLNQSTIHYSLSPYIIIYKLFDTFSIAEFTLFMKYLIIDFEAGDDVVTPDALVINRLITRIVRRISYRSNIGRYMTVWKMLQCLLTK
jgi:hypothetical protein